MSDDVETEARRMLAHLRVHPPSTWPAPLLHALNGMLDMHFGQNIRDIESNLEDTGPLRTLRVIDGNRSS